MLELLKIIHFMALGTGVGLGIANMVIGPRAAAAGAADKLPIMDALRATQGALGRIGLGAIILLWISGVWMWIAYDNSTLAPVFLAKIGFVVILTGLSIDLNLKGVRAAKGGPKPDPAFVKRAGMAMGLMSFLAVCAAVILFK